MDTAQPDAPKPSHSWIWVVAGTLTVVLLLAGVFDFAYLRDEPPPDDADLRTPPPMVADEQNGFWVLDRIKEADVNFVTFSSAHNVDEDTAVKIVDGDESNDALVAQFLAQAEPTLAEVNAALARPSFEFSKPVNIETFIPEISPIFNSGKALMLAARHAKSQADYPTALRQLAQVRLLARRLAESHNGFVVVLTSAGIEGLAVKEGVRWLNDPQTPPEATAALAKIFADPVPWTASLQFSYKFEYQVIVEYVHELHAHPELVAKSAQSQDSWVWHMLAHGIKVNQTLRMAERIYRWYIEEATRTYAEAQSAKNADLPGKVSGWDLFFPNAGGRYILATMTPSAAGIFKTVLWAETANRLAQVACALRRYYDDHHALPAKLDTLVPQYLPALPMDPFDGKLLRYDSAKAIVYSVGTSLKNNGGSRFLTVPKDNPDYDDPSSDEKQPTLQLTFQNPTTAAKPADAAH